MLVLICVADLKVGMILAEAVKGSKGRLLLPAGATLEEQHLRIFNIWGVSEAEIRKGSLGGDNGTDEDSVRKAARQFADSLFVSPETPGSPMAFLKGACTKLYADLITQGQELHLPEPPDSFAVESVSPAYDNVEDFLEKDMELGSFPDVYYKIMDAVDDPLSTATTLAETVSTDPGISSRLLSLVNSPVFGYSQPVDSLNRAVSMVGTKGLSQIGLGMVVMERFKGLDSSLLTMMDFWKHSLACGAINRVLAAQIPDVEPDLLFVAGMLHDVGHLAMLRLDPERIALVHSLCHAKTLPIHVAEKQVFGFNHCDVAMVLFRKWNFPEDLVDAIIHHHGPYQDGFTTKTAICSVGNTLAKAMLYRTGGALHVHDFDPGAWETLQLPESALATTISKARRQIDDLLTTFLGNA